MTIINATIFISGTTTPLDGYIRVITEASFSDELTLFVPVAKDYALVSGTVSFDLEPSDIAKVAYKFEIWQTVPDTVDEDSNPVVEPDILLKDFTAIVPYSASPINIKDLAGQVGVRYDAQDSALLTLSRYLQASDTFWSSLVSQIWVHKGAYNASLFYKRGDVVTWDGSGYQYIFNEATAGNLPSNTTYWRLLAAKGDTGTGTSGNDAAYGVAWNGATDAPSRNAVYDIIQTLATSSQLSTYAPLNAASLVNPVLDASSTLLAAENSSKIPSTAWVQTIANEIRKALVPVGTIVGWTTGSAPTGWLLCDGRAVSRTTYATLFTLLGTTFGNGDGSTTFNVPDYRGRFLAGADNMSGLMGAASRLTLTSIGNAGGSQTKTISSANLPAHSHGIEAADVFNTGAFITNDNAGDMLVSSDNIANGTNAWVKSSRYSTQSTGSGTALDITPPALATNIIIYTGV